MKLTVKEKEEKKGKYWRVEAGKKKDFIHCLKYRDLISRKNITSAHRIITVSDLLRLSDWIIYLFIYSFIYLIIFGSVL